MFNVIDLQVRLEANKAKTEGIMKFGWRNHQEHNTYIKPALTEMKQTESHRSNTKSTFNQSVCCA